MLSRITSFGLAGINGYPITIEADLQNGLPGCSIVGLADTAVKESKDRVRSAIKNSGFDYPITSIIINLAPADTKKEGTLYDLPIALAILISSGQLKKSDDYIILGELSLNGETRYVTGLLPMLISAREQNYKKAIIPFENIGEASYIEGIDVYPVKTLKEATEFIAGKIRIPKVEIKKWRAGSNSEDEYDIKYIKGQYAAKRAMEVAVAGGHNILLIGPPGAGKTMLARAAATIMPDLSFDEALDIAKIHSAAGILDKDFVFTRPFRAPHHSASMVSLTGGGAKIHPGEISLAHRGVLFLDELPEYSRKTLEALRQPLEDGTISIARASGTVMYPARFMLIASMNPCPCGNYGSAKDNCTCSAGQIHSYLAKLSGPLLDRIDIHVEVDSISYSDISSDTISEDSAAIKLRIDKARNIQRNRFENTERSFNAAMTSADIKKYCKLDKTAAEMLEMSFERLKMSARAYNRILKVARTIADLAGAQNIRPQDIAEAVQYRSLDRKYRV